MLSTFFGCTAPKDKHISDAIKIGVIETTGYKHKSYLHFYDENLNALYIEENNYASLSEPFDSPIFQDGYMYSIPKGDFDRRAEKCILQYDCKNDMYKEFDVGLRSMNSLAVSSDYLFGVNTINTSSTLVRCTIKSGETLSAQFPFFYLRKIAVCGEKLYAIANDIGRDTHNVFFMELSLETLEIIEKYDITQYGSSCELVEHNNKLYISTQYSDVTVGIPSTTITVFDLETKTFDNIDTGVNTPNNMCLDGDLMFVSHYEQVNGRGNSITTIDLNSGSKKNHAFDHIVQQIALSNDFIYILGEDELYQYRYENEGFVLINRTKIEKSKSRTYFYITSFFVCS